MKTAYPIIMTQEEQTILVYVPDFDANTEGNNYADAMEMARDAIGLLGITMEDEHREIPAPSRMQDVTEANKESTVTLVDIDFTEYRRMNDTRTVRRNVSLPNWLNVKAEESGLNVSAILQKALKAELNLV